MLKHFFLALALAAITGMATANELHQNANRQVALSIGAQHLDYAEIDDSNLTLNGVLDTERGGQPLLQGSFSYQGDLAELSDFYVRLDVSSAQGETRYQGYLQDLATGELTPYADTTKNRFYDASLRLGRSFIYADDPNWQFTPYLSYAARHWVRELAKPYGYRENYEHQEAGGGLLLQWTNPNSRMVVGLDAGYAQMIEARMDAPEFNSKFTLGTKGTFSATLSLDLAIGQNGHLTAGYNYKNFKYGISGVVNGMVEPNSKSTTQRVFLGYAIAY